jgi:hypothetical protein
MQPLLVLAATAGLRDIMLTLSPGLTAFLSGGHARVAPPGAAARALAAPISDRSG